MDKSTEAAVLFDKYAEEYQNRFMDVALYHEALDVLCATLEKENADVLELACGPGNITKYLLDRRPDLQLLGTDLAPKMLALAEKNNPTANFQLLDCRKIKQLNQQFDAIIFGFCLPYLSKEEAIQNLVDGAEMLRPNGVLYLSTMEDDYEKSHYQTSSTNSADGLFIHYHQADYLKAALKELKLEIVLEQRKEYEDAKKQEVVDLILIAKK